MVLHDAGVVESDRVLVARVLVDLDTFELAQRLLEVGAGQGLGEVLGQLLVELEHLGQGRAGEGQRLGQLRQLPHGRDGAGHGEHAAAQLRLLRLRGCSRRQEEGCDQHRQRRDDGGEGAAAPACSAVTGDRRRTHTSSPGENLGAPYSIGPGDPVPASLPCREVSDT